MKKEAEDYILDRAIYFIFGAFVGVFLLALKIINGLIVMMETYNIPVDITFG